MFDEHLRDALILVGYMGFGVLLGVVSRRMRPWRMVAICSVVVCAGVLWNTWRYFDWHYGASGLLMTLLGGFFFYTLTFAGLLLLPFVCARIAADYVAKRLNARTR